ncbi:MAG: DUF5011 domain-containing protein [Bacteroidales bacterium]|jgi:hypothetical protein|nr:DUF5011 domain-containing protein [Bacteroidales bacterium]
MKKSLYLIVCAAALFVLGSCQKLTTEGLTRTTYYPVLGLEGDDPFVVTLGSAYVEPGYTATLNGEDVSDGVTISSNVDTSAPGIYQVTYSAVNEDGFSASINRNVYVLNPGGIDNVYSSSCHMGSRSYSDLPIVITKVSDDTYMIEDLCGGFYCYGRYPGYEPSYDFHAETLFKIEADNSITLGAAGDWYFKSSFNYANFEGTYDPATGVIDYFFDDLYVTLTPLA